MTPAGAGPDDEVGGTFATSEAGANETRPVLFSVIRELLPFGNVTHSPPLPRAHLRKQDIPLQESNERDLNFKPRGQKTDS